MRCFKRWPISAHEGSWVISSFLAFLEDEGVTCSFGTGVVARVVGPDTGIVDRPLLNVPYLPLTGLRPVEASGANRKEEAVVVGVGAWISAADPLTGA